MAELAADSVDIRTSDATIYFYIVRGWIDDIPAVRGADSILSGQAGRFARNRVADYRRVLLAGQVKGTGATEALARASYLAKLESLQGVWSPTASSWDLVVDDEYKGLASGQTATITVRTINVIPAADSNGFRRAYSWELECITDPPAWVFSPA